jgi:hypothetical protein
MPESDVQAPALWSPAPTTPLARAPLVHSPVATTAASAIASTAADEGTGATAPAGAAEMSSGNETLEAAAPHATAEPSTDVMPAMPEGPEPVHVPDLVALSTGTARPGHSRVFVRRQFNSSKHYHCLTSRPFEYSCEPGPVSKQNNSNQIAQRISLPGLIQPAFLCLCLCLYSFLLCFVFSSLHAAVSVFSFCFFVSSLSLSLLSLSLARTLFLSLYVAPHLPLSFPSFDTVLVNSSTRELSTRDKASTITLSSHPHSGSLRAQSPRAQGT